MKHKSLVITLMLFLATLTSFAYNNESKLNIKTNRNSANHGIQGVGVILDTDMTLDVDDVGALAVLHGLQTDGKATILAVCYDEVNYLALSVIDAINSYYHRGNIPIGFYPKVLADPDTSDYFTAQRNDDVDNMDHDLSDNTVSNAVDVYKQILSSQPDNSVVIISVGFLNNLYDLLKDPEGYNLVKNKVKQLAVMGGRYNDGFNFVRHNLVDQSEYVIQNWPRELVISDAGNDMITGETLTDSTPTNNPVRISYELEYGVGPHHGRSSWDPVTVMYGVLGSQDFNEIWSGDARLSNGYTWNFSEGWRGYVTPKSKDQLTQDMETLMTLPPPADNQNNFEKSKNS